MRLSLLKIVGVTLFVTWSFIAISVLKIGSYLPKNTAPVVSQNKGTYFESLYYSTLYDDAEARLEANLTGQSLQDSSYRATSKADQITQKAEKELERDFLDVISTYLENVNYYRGELRKANPLMKFGFYKPFDEKYLEFYHSGKNKYKKAHFGLMNEPCYCEIADFYNIYHPENLLSEKNIFTDYSPDGVTRKGIVRAVGKDEMPQIFLGMPRADSSQRKYFLSKKITMFFTKSDNFHYFHEMGKNFLGFSQMYNHIPGAGALRRFDVFNHLSREWEKALSKNAKCLNYTDTFVRTYKMSDKAQCQEYFKDAYKPNENLTQSTQWLIYDYAPTANEFKRSRPNQEWKSNFSRDYQNGEKCGEKRPGKLMIQDYQKKVLKNGSHVVLLRYYVLISSTNPLKVYIHDGNFVSYKTDVFFNGEHPESEKDKKNNTVDQIKSGDIIVDIEDNIQEFMMSKASNNSGASNDTASDKSNSILTKIEEESTPDDAYDSSFDDEPNEAFPEASKITIDEFLTPFFNESTTREQIKQKLLRQATKTIIQSIKIAEPYLQVHSGVFELFGANFVVSDRLIPRLLNFEASPNLFGASRGEFIPMFKALLFDVFDIEYSYLRSRMIRFQKFLYDYHSDVVSRRNVTIADYEKKFEKINQNYVEPDYKFEPKSKFKKVLDLSPGSNLTFANYIEPECLALVDGAHA